jgi:DNA-binding Lrp family transcriptional regulator
MKKTELKLIAELMKNSRRSDRELARVLKCSQPTVSRMIKKLEKQGYIKEYTMIPDFQKLGYTLMGATLIGVIETPEAKTFEEIRKKTQEVEKSHPHALLMAVNGQSGNKNRLFITFYEDYSAYSEAMRLTKSLPYARLDTLESFLVDLSDETNYKLLTMSSIAEHLLKTMEEEAKS